MDGLQWWQGAVIYQIYPRSFCDSNSDGIGDLRGIIEKLPYLASLGIDAIWIAPFFSSPMKDFGYDVSDYRLVDPMFGSNQDFSQLIDQSHQLGLKVVIDMVASHTSDQHQWFEKSRSSLDNEKCDWYVWSDPKADGSPPNNWQSVFGGSAWEWDGQRQQYYLHNFLASQPDLNFHCPQLRHAVLQEFRYWLELGVDGFRLDTANYYLHDAQLRDNPPRQGIDKGSFLASGSTPYNYQEHKYDKNRPENIAWLNEMRTLANEYQARVLIGEIGDRDASKLMGEYTQGSDRLHTAYSFKLLTDSKGAEFIAHAVNELAQDIQDGWPTWAMSNHDVPRVASRWFESLGSQADAQDLRGQQSKFYLALLSILPGSMCLYNGEELGLEEAELEYNQLQDPVGLRGWPIQKGRDGCRTPMPWLRDQQHAGFTQGQPWLPLSESHAAQAADVQELNPNSVLNFTKEFLAWKKQYPQFRSAQLHSCYHQGDLLVLQVGNNPDHQLCGYFNFSARPLSLSLDEDRDLLTAPNSAAKIKGGNLELQAWDFAFFLS